MHRYCIMQHGFYFSNTIYQYFSWLEFKWHNDLETRHPWIWIASACGLVDSDFTNDAFLGHYPILQPMCTLLWFVFVRNGSPASRLKVTQCHALVNGYSYPSVLFGAHGSFLRPPIGLLLINHTFSYLSYSDIMCNMFKNNAFDLCDHALHMQNRNIVCKLARGWPSYRLQEA